MAEANPSKSTADSDQDFEPSEEMLVNDFDDEQTLEEEEALESADSVANELDDLQREGEMPLNEVLAMYGIESSVDNEDTIQKACEQDSGSSPLKTSEQALESHSSPHSIPNHPINLPESDSCLSEGQGFEAFYQLSETIETESEEGENYSLDEDNEENYSFDEDEEENYSPEEDEEDKCRVEEYEYLITMSNKYIKKAKSSCKFVFISKEEYDEGILQQQSKISDTGRDGDSSPKDGGPEEECDEAMDQQQSEFSDTKRDDDSSPHDDLSEEGVEYFLTENNRYIKKKSDGNITKVEYDEGRKKTGTK